MEKFKQFRKDNPNQLDEVLITFGNKAYPKFNNVVIMAGGAGSGKGFVKKNLLGIEGWPYDVDRLKSLSMMTTVFASKVKSETGIDLNKIDLSKADNVSTIHNVLSGLYNVDKKFQDTTFKSIATAHPDRKPNLIFDVTMKSLESLQKISKSVKTLGYDKENIHVVWVVNDVKVAIKQNLDPKRGRVVPEDILVQTHEGVALTMKKLLGMGSKLKQYLNGDIWLAFNKVGIDTQIKTSKSGGMFIDKANIIKIKKSGKTSMTTHELETSIFDKIAQYTPKVDAWIKKRGLTK